MVNFLRKIRKQGVLEFIFRPWPLLPPRFEVKSRVCDCRGPGVHGVWARLPGDVSACWTTPKGRFPDVSGSRLDVRDVRDMTR